MNKRKLAIQGVALVLAYGVACSDPRELFLHPAQSPARAVGARVRSSAEPVFDASLSVEQVASVVRAMRPSLEASCRPLVQPSTVSAPLKVALRLAIEPGGHVRRIEVDRATSPAGLASCVALGLASLHFPDGLSESNLTVSLAFSPEPLPAKLEVWTTP